jgi:hypothetical protein
MIRRSLAALCLALATLAPAARADFLEYTWQAQVAGTLDGAPFPLQGVEITLLADNTDIEFTGVIWTLPATSARFALDVSGAGSITTQLFVNVNPEFGSLILANAALAILLAYDTEFLTWVPVSPIGPLALGGGAQEVPLSTSAGTLVLTSASDIVFEAPEPAATAAHATLVGALAAIATTSRRGRSRRGSSVRRA